MKEHDTLAVLRDCAKERRRLVLAAILAEAEGRWEEKRLVITFPRDWEWHYRELTSPERQRELMELFQELYPGGEFEVRLLGLGEGEREGEAALAEEHAMKVAMVKRLFTGRV